MYRFASRALLVPLLLVLGACAGAPKLDAAKDKLAGIKTIAVTIAPEPKGYFVTDLGSPGAMFGLIGAAISIADQNSKQGKLTSALQAQKFAANAPLAEKVAAGLRAMGYDATVEQQPWGEVEGKITLKYEDIRSNADAVLVLPTANVGFIAPRMGADYDPTVLTAAILLDRDRKTQIYRGFHSAGYKLPSESWRYTASKTTYPTFEAIMQNTVAAAGSLTAAADAVAATILEDLKR